MRLMILKLQVFMAHELNVLCLRAHLVNAVVQYWVRVVHTQTLSSLGPGSVLLQRTLLDRGGGGG